MLVPENGTKTEKSQRKVRKIPLEPIFLSKISEVPDLDLHGI